MYVILKNHRIKESICHSIPRALKAKFYNCISPSGGVAEGEERGYGGKSWQKQYKKYINTQENQLTKRA